MKRASFGVAILIAFASAAISMMVIGRTPAGLPAQQPGHFLGTVSSDE